MEKEKLVQAADELNKVLGLEPVIPLDLSQQEIEKLVIEASRMVVENDVFSSPTWSVLLEMGELSVQVKQKVTGLLKQKKGRNRMAKEKENLGKSVWGHKLGSVSGKMDVLITENKHTIDQIATQLGCRKERVRGHLAHLRSKGVKVSIVEGSAVVVVKTE